MSEEPRNPLSGEKYKKVDHNLQVLYYKLPPTV